MIKSKAKLDYDFLLTDHSLRVAPLWKADDFATLFSSRWPSPGSSMAGSVWHLPAHHGAGERCDQPGAARPRMVQSKEIVQRLVTLSNARHGAKSCRFFLTVRPAKTTGGNGRNLSVSRACDWTSFNEIGPWWSHYKWTSLHFHWNSDFKSFFILIIRTS